jgi:hypothetical protein
MRRLALLLSLPALVLAGAAAPQHPDFSGRWKAQGPEGVTTTVIEHRDPALTLSVKTAYASRFAVATRRTYTIDGQEQALTNNEGKDLWLTARWDGPSLLLVSVEKSGRDVTVTRETWTPAPSGRAFTLTRRIISPAGVREETLHFERQ